MKRLLLIVVVLGAALFPSAGQARAYASSTVYQARVVACVPSLSAYGRHFKAEGVIRRMPGALRVGLRFDLFERPEGAHRFSRLAADGFGIWQISDPGYDLIVRKDVHNLPAPAAYYMRVTFRWYGHHGRILAQRQRATRTCFEPDMRPDLRVRAVTASTRPDGSTRYLAVIRNAGLTRAGSFDTVLQSAGMTVAGPTLTEGLAAGATVTVSFAGPACTSSAPPVVVVDPDKRVNERDEQNNSRPATCG